MKTVFQLFLLAVVLLIAARLITNIEGISRQEDITPLQVRELELPTKLPAKAAAPPQTPPALKTTPPPLGTARDKPLARPEPKPVLPHPAITTPIQNPEIILKILPSSPPVVLPQISDRVFYDRFANAVVQVFCTTPESVFTASGVIVNERGLILINAHIAEIIKQAGETHCRVKHGNPADAFANLQIVYEADITLKILDTQVPQYDFAFAKLTNPTAPFATVSIDLDIVERGTTLLTLGYPSEFLQSITAASNSNLVFSALTVDDLGDIDGDRTTAEAYVFRGGLVLQRGSSGTALFTRSGGVVGIIFATTKATTTAEREGFALMTSYINRVLQLETGQSLADFITSH